MSAVLGVVVGVAFMLLLLSLLASAVVEGIAGILRMRASMLERALRGVLVGAWDFERRKKRARTTSELAEQLLRDPALATGSPVTVPERAMAKRAETTGDVQAAPPARLRASYVPRDQFVDLVFTHYLGGLRPGRADLQKYLGDGELDKGMEALLGRLAKEAGGRVDVLRHRLGHHYDTTMDRVSGWYRRRTRWMLFGVGVILAIGFNVGLLSMARALWADDALRADIAAIAAQQQSTPSSDPTAKLSGAGTALRAAADKGLPIGWGNRSAPKHLGGWLAAAAGWLAVGVGVSFGAPFWFDALGKFVNLRLAGPKPSSAPLGTAPGIDDAGPLPPLDPSAALAPTDGPVLTGFDPTVHGFHFKNDFENEVPVPFHKMNLVTYGRCGGMVYAGLDLFRSGQAVPAERELPSKESPLGVYLLKRLFDSWANPSALRFLTWTLDDDLTVAQNTRTELLTLYRHIDRGEPVPLGLVSSRTLAEIGFCHQVLAVGYERREDGTVVVHTWDNNVGDSLTTLTVPASGIGVVRSGRTNPYRGFFVHSYAQENPPADLATTV